MNIKKKLNLNNVQVVGLCATIALTLFGIVETILHIKADVPTSKTILICLSYLLILYYVFYGYKIPHGNSLKYIIIFFSLMLVNEIALEAGGKYPGLNQKTILFSVMVTGITIIIVSYISGRLNKYENNSYLFILTLILLFIRAILMVNYKTIMYSNISDIIVWIDLYWAYALRYNQHKEAGLKEN